MQAGTNYDHQQKFENFIGKIQRLQKQRALSLSILENFFQIPMKESVRLFELQSLIFAGLIF